jgi:iron-sulfur cluster protein
MADSQQPTSAISPREVANKSDKKHLLRAIRMTLEIQSPAVRHNTQTFNRNRYKATAALPDYDALKDEARKIKENAIAHLPHLISTLENVVRSRGGHVFIAATAEDARRYTLEICEKHSAKLVVKGKSITSEEIHLNHALEAAGIEVAESDLAEFILQVANEQPSHIIAPAIHYSRERITALFKRVFKTDLPLDTGEELTRFARERLREKFLRADVGITGANLIAADTGTIMLTESEGNIRMSSYAPPVHIAIAGVEKIIPTRREMGAFLELLAASGTGQKLSSYTTFISPPISDPPFAMPGKPRKDREFHLVLIDNGRMKMRDDPVLHETLYCIRCSACLNSCANFQTAGGHAFGGETYSGGIGGSWEAGTGTLENARFSDLCTGCSRCVNQCPVRIDIPWLNENLRERLNQKTEPTAVSGFLGMLTSAAEKDRSSPASRIFFGNYHFFARLGSRFPSLSNASSNTKVGRAMMERFFGLDRRRALPPFPEKTLVQSAKNLGVAAPTTTKRSASKIPAAQNSPSENHPSAATATPPAAKVVLFADIFTNYGLVERGIATIKLLKALNIDVIVSESLPDGRAALSQGMISTAKQHAARAAAMLETHLADGREVIVVEPTSLAMFRRDFRHLLENKIQFERLRQHAFEPLEYIALLLKIFSRNPKDFFDVSRSPVGTKLFYHAHCQQKTIGAADATIALLCAIGFDVATSEVECCGMAGSFGYKKDYYDLSLAVGADLFQQVTTANASGTRALVASGTSCTEQLRSGTSREVIHPTELLAAILRPSS